MGMCVNAKLAERGTVEECLPARLCLSRGEGVVGVLGRCTNTEVYPRVVRSKFAVEGDLADCVSTR